MKTEIKYIELKTGGNHNGPAWIGLVSFSKSGKTIYFNGKAFQGIGSGNFYDIETGEGYWISGVKRDMSDRHVYGNGKIFVEKRILNDYLKIVNKTKLNEHDNVLCEVDEELPILKINEIENQKREVEDTIDENRRFLKPSELNDEELDYFIEYYEDGSINGRFLKGRKYSRNMLNNLLEEKEKRKAMHIKMPTPEMCMAIFNLTFFNLIMGISKIKRQIWSVVLD